jgi:hypothetical protein
MKISLLENTLVIDVFYEKTDSEFDDNICVSFAEPCEEEERLFRACETNIYLTAREARQLAQALLEIADESDLKSKDEEQKLLF